MNSLILEVLSSREELVTAVGSHIAKAGGKRIRPILTLLSAKLFGCNNPDRIKLAAAVEFIHMATLLHDDVVDGSKMRRFLPAANTIWGSRASILVGDFLFSQSFRLMVAAKSMAALKALSDASAIIAEGEVAQLAKLKERRILNESEYFKIINAKTATLFSAASETGAIIAEQPLSYVDALREFGLKLGGIYQIADDLLDYFNDPLLTGKNVGDDFAEGKVTLPIIFLANKLNNEDRHKLSLLFAADERNPEDFNWVLTRLEDYNIKAMILNYIENTRSSITQSLAVINKENESKNYLNLLVDFAANRNY